MFNGMNFADEEALRQVMTTVLDNKGRKGTVVLLAFDFDNSRTATAYVQTNVPPDTLARWVNKAGGVVLGVNTKSVPRKVDIAEIIYRLPEAQVSPMGEQRGQ